MYRNGRREEMSSQYCSSSSMLTTLAGLAGGVGLGAGLLYLLDPDKGSQRRHNILSGAQHLGESLSGGAAGLLSSVSHYAGDAADRVRGAASSARDYADDATSGIRGFASAKMAGARDALERQVCGETRSERIVGQTICALGSMALGAALMYVLDPAAGQRRRQLARDKMHEYSGRASDAMRNQYNTARDSVSHLASQARDSVSNMASQARDKVSNLTSGGSTSTTGSNAPSCPPGMVPNPALGSSVSSPSNTF